jgi:arsenate reductase
MLTNTFAGIAPSSVPVFVVVQVVGALAAVAPARYLFPGVPAADLVVPHDSSGPT